MQSAFGGRVWLLSYKSNVLDMLEIIELAHSDERCCHNEDSNVARH